MIHHSVESMGPCSWGDGGDAELGRELATHLRPRLTTYFDPTVEEVLPAQLLILVSRFARVTESRDRVKDDPGVDDRASGRPIAEQASHRPQAIA
jgi:hypothetical protein